MSSVSPHAPILKKICNQNQRDEPDEQQDNSADVNSDRIPLPFSVLIQAPPNESRPTNTTSKEVSVDGSIGSILPSEPKVRPPPRPPAKFQCRQNTVENASRLCESQIRLPQSRPTKNFPSKVALCSGTQSGITPQATLSLSQPILSKEITSGNEMHEASLPPPQVTRLPQQLQGNPPDLQMPTRQASTFLPQGMQTPFHPQPPFCLPQPPQAFGYPTMQVYPPPPQFATTFPVATDFHQSPQTNAECFQLAFQQAFQQSYQQQLLNSSFKQQQQPFQPLPHICPESPQQQQGSTKPPRDKDPVVEAATKVAGEIASAVVSDVASDVASSVFEQLINLF